MLALVTSVSAVAVFAFCQWRVAGPVPSARAVMKEFSVAVPVGSSEDEIIAYLDRRGVEHSVHTTESGDAIVLDYGVRAGARVIEARIQQHDSRPISLATSELVLTFVMTEEHRLERLVVFEMDTGI